MKKLVVFNSNHKLDLEAEILYFSYEDMMGIDDYDRMIEHIKAFKPDLIIEEEKNDGKSIYTNVYKQLPGIPKAYWLIDGHCNLIDHVVYAKQFDYVFCAQSWFMPIIQREVLNRVFYLPLCHTQTMTEYQEMLKTKVKKDIELSFIGNIRSIHVDRKKHVQKLLEMYPNFFARQSNYEDTLKYLRRSKATFNCSLNNDLNFRVWEGLACGSLVVTDDVTDIDNIYGLRPLLTVYDKLLPNWQSLDIPQMDGEAFIKGGHTLTHRMLQLIAMTEGGEQVEF